MTRLIPPQMHSPTHYNTNSTVPFTAASEDFAMYAQSLPVYNQHGELTSPYPATDYDNTVVPIMPWSSEPEIKKQPQQQHYYPQQRSQYTPQCPPRIKEEDYQLYHQTAFVKHPYYNFSSRTTNPYPQSTDPSLSPLSAYADFDSHHYSQQQPQQHHWQPSPPTTTSSLSPQSHRRSSLASSIDSIRSDINPPNPPSSTLNSIVDVDMSMTSDMNMAAMHSIARSSLINGINTMGSIGLNNHPHPHHQMSMSPLDMNSAAQAHISVGPPATYPHQHLQTIDMGQHNSHNDHNPLSGMNGHSHGVGVGVNPAGVNPVGVLGHDIDSRLGMDGSTQMLAGTVGVGSLGLVDDMSEEDAEGEDDWEQLQQQDPSQDYQAAAAAAAVSEVYQNGWSEEVEEEQINTREVAAAAVHQQQKRQRQLSREARKMSPRSARKSHSTSSLSAREQQHRLYTHLVKPDPADEDDRISRSSLEEEEFDESSEEDMDDDDDDDEFIPGQQASQRRRRFRSTTTSSRRGASGSNLMGYSANGNDSAPSLHHFSQNGSGGGGGYATSEGRRTARSTGGLKYNTYSSYIEQANASGFYDGGNVNGEDRYSSGSGSPAPEDGGRSLSRGSAGSTSPSLSSKDKLRRSRPVSNVPIPVPVPNLTKKSRGRRVPTMSSLEDLRSAASGAGRKRQNAAGKNARMYLCDIEGCGKCFARGEHLKRHVRSIHTYDKPHRCPYPGCGKRFSRHDNLGQHMRVHKDYVPPPGSISSAGSGL